LIKEQTKEWRADVNGCPHARGAEENPRRAKMKETMGPDEARSRAEAGAGTGAVAMTRIVHEDVACDGVLSVDATLKPAPWRKPFAKIFNGVASQFQRPDGGS
jgi:hypothetical protein